MPVNTSVTTSESSLTYGNAVGNKAYDFSLPDVNDNYVNLSSLQGRPVMLNFWSTT
jgi:peroxiredoxin